ncbi:MAG: hypothetical protein M1827_004603 [Pycnora praestabilis]|nr:MAG: hypothetical protein M1827_004603 [Pycnora praestabilis]
MPPSTMRAIVIQGPKQAKLVSDAPVPKLRDEYILVKVVAVALNPTDWKHIDFLADKGAIVGCDYAGIVEEVGKGVRKDFKKGDRIAGFVHGGNAVEHEDGAFAEYVIAKYNLALKIPDTVSFEEASTLGVGISTIGQGLYQSLKLPLPTEPAKEKIPLLIYGGSTATGGLAIQFAKMSNLSIIVTCSAHNFAYVKSLGADAAFSYKDPSCAAQIRDYTNNNLTHIFDTIALPGSAQICADAMSSTGGTYSSLLPVDFPRQQENNVQNKRTLAYTGTGETFTMGRGGPEFPGTKADFDFQEMFWEMTETLLREGRFQAHRPNVRKGGLEGVFDGLQELREDRVSGEKLVYRVGEMP